MVTHHDVIIIITLLGRNVAIDIGWLKIYAMREAGVSLSGKWKVET